MADGKPDGAVDELMTRLFGRSWRTSLTGFVSLVAGVVSMVPGLDPTVIEIARMVALAATGGGLMLAKDRSVSGAK